MFTLATADTLAGVADAASKVTYTLFGMELNGTTETYKVLAQGQLSNVAATIYTAPASNIALVKSAVLVNTDTAASHTGQLFRGGTAATNQTTCTILIPAGGMANYEDGCGWQIFNASGQLVNTIVANRANLPADAKNWTLLGTATGATTTIGPVIWTGTYQQLMIEYFINGYNGGTPVGRLLFGAASISTTALTNGSILYENSTAATHSATSAPSIPGVPLAVTLSSISRWGVCWVNNQSGKFKRYRVTGQNGNESVSTPATLYDASGMFSDLGTNLPLQRVQMSVYDTLTATAVSAQTFTSSSYFTVWGRNND